MLLRVTFKERIDRILAENKVDLAELARRAKLSRGTIYAVIDREKKGNYDIRLSTARAIAKVSGHSIAWILGLDPVPVIEPSERVDSLVVAEQAAAALVEHNRATPEEAWLAMRGLRVLRPDTVDYYAAALERLDRKKKRSTAADPLRSPERARSAQQRFSSRPPPLVEERRRRARGKKT